MFSLISSMSEPQTRYSSVSECIRRCFPTSSTVEVHTDLPLVGLKLASASPEQGEAYDRRVIEFFDRTLLKQ